MATKKAAPAAKKVLSAEEKAQHNYQQVAKLATLIRSMDKKVATPEIARHMLSIPSRQQ